MNTRRFARRPHAATLVMLASTLSPLVSRASAQSPQATVPIVVAQAAYLEFAPIGKPTYYSGLTSPDWPVSLVPPGATVVGSAVVGDTGVFRMRTAVFQFSSRTNPPDVLTTMLTLDGFGPPTAAVEQPNDGGFLPSTAAPPKSSGKLCKGSVLATFAAVDPQHAPGVFGIDLLDGEAGRQACAPQRSSHMIASHFPVSVPALVAPAGAMTINAGGSSWSGSSGDMRSALRTTMPADSILAHYTALLVAGGWKADGRSAVANGVGVQRLTFHDGQDAWTGILIIMAVGDRRDIDLQVSRVD